MTSLKVERNKLLNLEETWCLVKMLNNSMQSLNVLLDTDKRIVSLVEFCWKSLHLLLLSRWTVRLMPEVCWIKKLVLIKGLIDFSICILNAPPAIEWTFVKLLSKGFDVFLKKNPYHLKSLNTNTWVAFFSPV